jgi:hypothetical protein
MAATGTRIAQLPFALGIRSRRGGLGACRPFCLVSDFCRRSMMHHIARLFRAHSAFPLEHVATFRFVPGVAWSDHLSFWRSGYRALMVTDTAFYRNLHYHRADDTPDTLAYPQLAEVTEGLFLSLAELAQSGFDAT